MPQSSLVAWLKQPPSVKQTQSATQLEQPTPGKHVGSSEDSTLPTPPPSSDDETGTKPKSGKSEVIPASLQTLRVKNTGLPPNVEFRACTREDIPALKRLNSLLLPIPYPASFYREITEDSLTNNITLLAFWHDKSPPSTKDSNTEHGRIVGAIRCRILAHPPSHKDARPMLYLSTLVLLSPYRSHGIAGHMLQILTKRAINGYGVGSVGAHVWEANDEGLEWYRKRGFRGVGREDGYYRKLKPMGAVVVQREIGPSDLLGEGG